MFTPDITIGTNIYSLTQQRTSGSLRSDPSKGILNPLLMTISHEEAKNGKISSVVILDSEVTVDSTTALPVSDNIRVLFKIQYNPTSGRTGTAAELERLRALLVTFINTPANINKLLNKES